MPHLEQRVGPLAGGMAQQTTATHGPDQSRPLFDFRIWPISTVCHAAADVGDLGRSRHNADIAIRLKMTQLADIV